MTVRDAIELTLNLLADCGVGDWNVAVVETLGKNERGNNIWGQCYYDHKTIYLSTVPFDEWMFGDDRHVLETIRHEIAHVLAEGDSHGERFERALELVPSVPSRKREFRIELSKPAAPITSRVQ